VSFGRSYPQHTTHSSLPCDEKKVRIFSPLSPLPLPHKLASQFLLLCSTGATQAFSPHPIPSIDLGQAVQHEARTGVFVACALQCMAVYPSTHTISWNDPPVKDQTQNEVWPGARDVVTRSQVCLLFAQLHCSNWAALEVRHRVFHPRSWPCGRHTTEQVEVLDREQVAKAGPCLYLSPGRAMPGRSRAR